MITDFGDQLTRDLFYDLRDKVVKKLGSDIYRKARMKLLYLHEAEVLSDLRVPPGNRLEKLKGLLKDFYSIRINDQWKILFQWSEGNASKVKVADYH
jgi:proteic killer suppression protein